MKRKIDETPQIRSNEIKHRKIFHVSKSQDRLSWTERNTERNKSYKRKIEECEDDCNIVKRTCNTDLLHSAYSRYFEEVYKTYCDPDQESYFHEKFEENKAYYIY